MYYTQLKKAQTTQHALFLSTKTYPVLPSAGFAQLRVFSGVPDCEYTIQTNNTDVPDITINGIDYWFNKYIKIEQKSLTISYLVIEKDTACPKFPEGIYTFNESTAYGIFLHNKRSEHSVLVYEDDVEKSNHANPLVRNLANLEKDRKIIWKANKSGNQESISPANNNSLFELHPTSYEVLIDNVKIHEEKLRHGGVYTLIIGTTDTGDIMTKMIEITEPNSMSILWLIPQYFVMTLGEVMFSVTGLEFSYSQAPVTMKSVLQACWLLTVAFGNVIVVIVAELKIFKSQADEFFLFAGLMFVDMILFMYMAYRYKPNNPAPANKAFNGTEPLKRPEKTKFTKNQQQQQRLPRYSKRQTD